MATVSTILGSRTDPEFAERLHRLEHHGAVATVYLDPADLDRRRLRASADSGEEFLIALPRDQKLFDGAILALDGDRAVVVRTTRQRWICLLPDSTATALQLGFHAGNLHWKVRFDGERLFVACSGAPEDYLARIDTLLASGRVAVVEGVDP
jgi:urease accessory protein